jgi:hypothetical protein
LHRQEDYMNLTSERWPAPTFGSSTSVVVAFEAVNPVWSNLRPHVQMRHGTKQTEHVQQP